MPYIKQEIRKDLEPQLDELCVKLSRLSNVQRDGVVNYVITTILRNQYNFGRYLEYNSAIGVIESVKLEFYRKSVAPYEDTKIIENGDLD